MQGIDLHGLLFQITNETEVQSEEEEEDQIATDIQTTTFLVRLAEIFQNFKDIVDLVMYLEG